MAGSETLHPVEIGADDVAACMMLSSEAGWNQTEDDWMHFIARGEAAGVRNEAGRLVGSAAALPYDGPFGFVAMVLVTPQFRRRGIATHLVDRCIATLRRQGLLPVLDATAAGAEVYRKQGFLPQFGFDRWEGTVEGSAGSPDRLADADALIDLDAAALGARRPRLMDDFLRRAGTHGVLADDGNGFALVRRGRRALQAGPVVAASEQGALRVLQRLFATIRGLAFIDVPSAWAEIGRWLRAQGFAIQRSFTRMALGRSEPFGDPSRLFAVAGPEFG